jgi:hypothetical protein
MDPVRPLCHPLAFKFPRNLRLVSQSSRHYPLRLERAQHAGLRGNSAANTFTAQQTGLILSESTAQRFAVLLIFDRSRRTRAKRLASPSAPSINRRTATTALPRWFF